MSIGQYTDYPYLCSRNS